MNSYRTTSLSLLLTLIAFACPSSVDADDTKVEAISFEGRFHIGNYSLSEVRKIWTSKQIAPFEQALEVFPTPHECGIEGQSNLQLRWERLVTEAQIEVCLFLTLMEQPGRVYSRDQLLDHVSGRDVYVDARTDDVHIGTAAESLEATRRR